MTQPHEAHIGQVPPNTEPENYDDARAQSNAGDSFGDTPMHDAWEPARIDREPKDRKNFHKGMIAGGLASAAAFLAVYGVVLKGSGPDDNPEQAKPDRPPISAEPFRTTTEVPTVSPKTAEIIERSDSNGDGELNQSERDAMSPSDYFTLSEEIRASDRAERFNLALESAYTSIQAANLSDKEREILKMPNLDAPRSTWTDQDYLNYNSLAVWLVTMQSDKSEALRALSVIYSVDSHAFNFVRKHIEENPGVGMKAIYEAQDSPLSNVELHESTEPSDEVAIGKDGGRLVVHKALSTESPYINVTVYANYSDNNGNIITVAQAGYDSLQESGAKSLVDQYS